MTMPKEKLRFKVGGRSIVYEGEASKRPQDLMEILVKLRTANDDVVPTFRENIEEQDSYTDADIMEMFEAARRAREEKRRAREESDKKPSDEPERPQKISLSFRGKVFSYEGLLSQKQSAVVQLLCKQPGVTQEVAWETFRANLPDSPLGEDEVWELVISAQALRRQQREQQQRQKELEMPVQLSHSQQGVSASTSGCVEGASASDYLCGGDALLNVDDDITLASFKELQQMPSSMREELNRYISDVISQPLPDFTSGVMQSFGGNTPMKHADPLALEEEEEGSFRQSPEKMVLYCQEGRNPTKLVHVSTNTTFEELAATVERKYGRPMSMSFHDGDEVIELDDDDVLSMFVEMSANRGRKLKLMCIPLDATLRKVEQEGPTSTTTSMKQGKGGEPPVQAFSSGELTVKELRTYTGHSMSVYCCAFSPNGKEFITASRDRSVRLWNLATSSCTVMKGGHKDLVLSCDFSPKGNRAVSSSVDRTIKIWNTSTCDKVATLRGHDKKVYGVQYNTAGTRLLSCSGDTTLKVWHAEKGSKLATLRGHTLAVFSCCFSKSDNGKYVASGGDDRLIKIWDWEAKTEVRSIAGHTGAVWSVAYSHDDKLLVSTSMTNELKLWDPRTGVCVRTLEGHEMPIHHAVFSMSDKYIFSCARDCTVMIWRTEDGERVETLAGHRSTVYHLDLWGKNRLLTSSLDETLKLWEFEEGK